MPGKRPRFVFQVYTTVIPQPSDTRYDVIGLDNATLHYTTDGIYLPELVHILSSDLSSDIRGQASSTQSTTTSSTEEELEDRNLVSSEKNIVLGFTTGIIYYPSSTGSGPRKGWNFCSSRTETNQSEGGKIIFNLHKGALLGGNIWLIKSDQFYSNGFSTTFLAPKKKAAFWEGREILLFQENPGWWNVIIWPDQIWMVKLQTILIGTWLLRSVFSPWTVGIGKGDHTSILLVILQRGFFYFRPETWENASQVDLLLMEKVLLIGSLRRLGTMYRVFYILKMCRIPSTVSHDAFFFQNIVCILASNN